MSTSLLVPKRERSPTPPLTLTPRTSGVKFVPCLPKACRRSSPNYQQARKEWAFGEINELNTLGLRVTKVLIRDDGLSLEWESSVPVWPDTLKPTNRPHSSSSLLPLVGPGDNDMQHRNAGREEDEFEKEASKLEELAIAFLERFVRTFDTDRAALASAYMDSSLFSYSVHEHSSIPPNSVAAAFFDPGAEVHRFAPQVSSRNLLQPNMTSNRIYTSPSEIIPALLSLGPHKFCARSPTDLRYNVLILRPEQSLTSEPLVFLSSHGDLIEEKADSEKRLSFDQCFILWRPRMQIPRRLDPDGNSDSRSNLWPLVAINHQLTVRDLSFRFRPLYT